MPLAVLGRWRATTMPATRTRAPWSMAGRSWLERQSSGRSGRSRPSGWSLRVTLVVA